MNEITQFRGLAGEVVKGFVRPGIFFTLVPVFIYWLLVLVTLFFLSDKIGTAASALVVLAAGVALIGRFAIPASKGDLHGGFFNVRNANAPGELSGFCLRYLCALLEWMIPLFIIAYFGLGDSFGAVDLGSAGQMGFKGILAVLVMILMFLGPTLCLIVALNTETLGEALGLDPWRWLWHFRRDDVLVFYAMGIGGMFVFLAVYAVPMTLAVVAAFSVSLEAGIFLSSFVYLVPALASPVLIGRLCGAFIIGEEFIGSFGTPPSDLGLPSEGSSGLIVASGIKPIDAEEISTRVASLAEDAIHSATERASERLSKDKEDLAALLELTLLHKRIGALEEAKAKATKTLALAALRDDSGAAVLAFRALEKERFKIEATSAVHEKLSDALLEAGHFGDAGWCANTALAEKAGQELTLQKKLVKIADAAAEAGSKQEAAALYTFFLKKFPDSNFSDYVKQALETASLK